MYAYRRGNFRRQRFWDFMVAETVGRLKQFPSYHLSRIFVSILSTQHAIPLNIEDISFLRTLATKVIDRFGYMPARGIASFVTHWRLNEAIFENTDADTSAAIDKMNIVISKRLRAWKSNDLLICVGFPGILHDILSSKNTISFFRGLMHRKFELQQNPKQFFRLKIAEMCIRHDSPQVYWVLPEDVKSYLKIISETAMTKEAIFKYSWDSANVYAPIKKALEDNPKYNFTTIVQGPYVMDVCDPMSRIYLDAQDPWLLYPNWRRGVQRLFTQHKWRHLKAQNWNLQKLPNEVFTNLADGDVNGVDVCCKYLEDLHIKATKE